MPSGVQFLPGTKHVTNTEEMVPFEGLNVVTDAFEDKPVEAPLPL